MPIDSKHPMYKKQENRWSSISDAVEGEDQVKSKNTEYLPEPPGMAGMGASWTPSTKTTRTTAYEFYQSFAEFPEIVDGVLNGFQGLIHSKPPTLVLPDSMEYLEKSATPAGDTIQSLWQEITRNILSGGRTVLLCDIDSDGMFKIVRYNAPDLINWAEIKPRDGGGLSFAVLTEERSIPDESDPYEHVDSKRILELSIDPETGNYTATWWESDGEGTWSISEEAETIEYKGKAFPEIPITIINSVDSGTAYGTIAMSPLAKRAYSIYRKTADYNRSLYQKSDPQTVITGLVDSTEAPTTIGGGSIWTFKNPNTKAEYLDIDGQGIPLQAKAIKDEYDRFYEEGGKLIHSEGGAGESGEALRRRQNSNQVTLKSVAINAAEHFEMVLKKIATYMGANPDEVIFTPDLDFSEPTMTGAELLAQVQASNQGGPLSMDSVHENMVRGGMTSKTFEEEMAAKEEDAANRIDLFGADDQSGSNKKPDPDDGEGGDEKSDNGTKLDSNNAIEE